MAEGNLTSPEGVMLILVAIVLDSIGFLLFLLGTWFGFDDYGILDIIGFIIIGGWIFVRTGNIRGTSGAKKALNRAGKRFGITFLVELCPFIGGLAPSWTILVWKELKGDYAENSGAELEFEKSDNDNENEEEMATT